MTDPIFCKRCLYSTAHPLGLTLDEEGICSGCRIHEEKNSLDWTARFEKLRALVERLRQLCLEEPASKGKGGGSNLRSID